MARPTVTSKTTRPNKFEIVSDVRGIGKGKASLLDLYRPATPSHTPMTSSVNVKGKDFGSVF